ERTRPALRWATGPPAWRGPAARALARFRAFARPALESSPAPRPVRPRPPPCARNWSALRGFSGFHLRSDQRSVRPLEIARLPLPFPDPGKPHHFHRPHRILLCSSPPAPTQQNSAKRRQNSHPPRRLSNLAPLQSIPAAFSDRSATPSSVLDRFRATPKRVA